MAENSSGESPWRKEKVTQLLTLYVSKILSLFLPRLPLQGRLDYANEMMSEIFDSVEKPLTVEAAFI